MLPWWLSAEDAQGLALVDSRLLRPESLSRRKSLQEALVAGGQDSRPPGGTRGSAHSLEARSLRPPGTTTVWRRQELFLRRVSGE